MTDYEFREKVLVNQAVLVERVDNLAKYFSDYVADCKKEKDKMPSVSVIDIKVRTNRKILFILMTAVIGVALKSFWV